MLDISILNTMPDKKTSTAKSLLLGTGISLLDAARLVRNILDAKTKNPTISAIEFCHKVIETGKRYIRTKEMSFTEGLSLYIESKSHLRSDSFRDIKYLSNRLMKSNSDFSKYNFSDFSPADCEIWLTQTFATPSQFNKGKTMLHGLFEFAFRREWCERNPLKLVERKKVIEKEIKPLSLNQTQELIKTAKSPKYKECVAAVAILAFAGVRPREVRRLKWKDIDLEESSITVRAQCSKTGGIRQVEMPPVLKNLLNKEKKTNLDAAICPTNWLSRWKHIREESGFKGNWIQDVLRHTYASFYAKYYRNLSRLQLNMGHRDQSLLRSRYVNMNNITRQDAKSFFTLDKIVRYKNP